MGNQESGTPYLETLRRRGYRFNGTVQLILDGSGEGPHSAHSVQVIEPIGSVRPATMDSPVNDLAANPYVWRQINPVNDLLEPRRASRLRRSSFAAIGVIAVVAALAFIYAYVVRPPSINSIAVMPFANESGNPQESLSDGLTSDLIERLSKVPGLEVKDLSTVVRYKVATSAARRIGQEQNVEAVLFGHLIETSEGLTLQGLNSKTVRLCLLVLAERKISDARTADGKGSRSL